MSEAPAGIPDRPFVFVTGPYSAPTEEDVARNIQRAVDVGRIVFERGYFPVVPHVLVRPYYNAADRRGPFAYEALMQYTLALVRKCEILLIYDHSPGADREWRLAEALGKPVYFDVDELPQRQGPEGHARASCTARD